MRIASSSIHLAAVLAAASALAGCGGEGESKKPASQVAAKVNKSEITVHQINGALASAGVTATPDQAKQVRTQVLDRLVDQELLVQQAGDKKLDRNPNVLQALESARRQVLSQAYVEQLTATVARPGADEVRKFYAENPALFAQRRVYRVREIAVTSRDEQAQRIAAAAESARSVNDFLGLLKTQGVSYTDNVTTKPAEQIPIQLLSRLSQSKDGQLLSLPTPGGVVVVHVLESQLAPASEKDATPFIEQYLMNQQKMQLTQAEVKRLRAAAKVEYVGEFSETASPAATTQSAPVPAPAAGPAVSSQTDSSVEKGLRGIK